MSHTLLSVERGIVTVLARRSSKPGTQIALDLFDEGEFRLELKPGKGLGFLKDAHVVRKRRDLARRYAAFESAARFSQIVIANPAHEENLENTFRLLTKGLDSWENGRDPTATYLKCLYLYCRAEGYPVKEDWAGKLAADAHAVVARTLNQPLQDKGEDPEILGNAVDSLETYVERFTSIRLGG